MDILSNFLDNNSNKMLKENLTKLMHIRNKFAHWIYIDSTQSFYNYNNEIKITEKLIYDYYDIFYFVENKLKKINEIFLEYDRGLIICKSWSNNKKKKIHKDRLNQIKKILKNEWSNKKYSDFLNELNIIFKI